jgi:Na+/melibiose symporter-like transporter
MEQKAGQSGRTSTKQKFLWGLGGFAENLANNALQTLAYPIFAVGMGISPGWVGTALSASRVVEVVTDPIMGNMTDNTKSRWGRRRPWIFVGGILMSILFAAAFFTPRPVIPRFSAQEITNLGALTTKLKQGQDPISVFTFAKFSTNAHAIVSGYPGNGTNQAVLADTVVSQLNNLVGGTLIYEPARFAGVNLRAETRALLKANPTKGEKLSWLNRRLFEDTYSQELLNKARPANGSMWSVVYLIIIVSLFYSAFTLWNIPFSGLGLELETDYSERTKLMIFRVAPSFIVGIAIGSLYLLTLQKDIWHGDEVTGARYVCCIVAVLMLITAIIPSIFCRERFVQPAHREKLGIWKSMALTFKDLAFFRLISSSFFVFVGLFFMIPLLTYISLYYSCQGDKMLMGKIGMHTSYVQATTQLLSMAAIWYGSKLFDKKVVWIGGLVIGIFGYVSSWFLFTPQHPYWTIFPPVIINIGLCACWVLMGSFNCDICDYDELKTGRRREGMYSAVFAFLTKLAIAFVMAISSWVLVRFGFEGTDLHPTAQQLFTLRWTYIAIPSTAMTAAILCMWKYPLTKARVTEIQAQLKQKKDAAAAAASTTA